MGSGHYNGQNFDLTKADGNDNSIVQNMVENLLQAFLMKGFPYLSVLEGGFQDTHDFAVSLKIQVERHNKNYCLACLAAEKSEKNVVSYQNERTSPGKNRLETEEKTKVLKEMLGKNQKNLNDEKFLFFCQRFENENCAKDEYMINLSSLWFEVGIVTPEIVHEFIKVKISGLIKLTIIKKNPRLLSLRFAELKEDLFFMMKSVEEAKLCVSQITKNFQLSLNYAE